MDLRPKRLTNKQTDRQTGALNLSQHQNKSLGADGQEKELLPPHLILNFPSTIEITAGKYKFCWACYQQASLLLCLMTR